MSISRMAFLLSLVVVVVTGLLLLRQCGRPPTPPVSTETPAIPSPSLTAEAPGSTATPEPTPTAAARPTSTPVPTSEQTEQPTEDVTVIFVRTGYGAGLLNFRSGPSRRSYPTVIGVLRERTPLTFLGCSDTRWPWVRVTVRNGEYAGRTGYVYARYVRPNLCGGVP